MKTVLVVDDALTIRAFHQQLLEEINFQVIVAENGMEALERSVECHLDLCLVDVNMPVMDGFTFVQQLREGSENSDCPVVMITTESSRSEESKGYAAGANLYLNKPCDPDRLQRICQMFLAAPNKEAERLEASELAQVKVIEPPVIDTPNISVSQSNNPLHSYVNDLMRE